jgi:hypothetical protein
MHYKNGREAKNGDKVVLVSPYNGGPVVMGILYDATAGNDYCNGKIAPVSSNNPCPNLKEVFALRRLHGGVSRGRERHEP